MSGQLRHLVDIRARVLIPDDVGGAAPSWMTIDTQWVSIVHLSSARFAAGGRENNLRRIAATLRHRSGVKLGHRLRVAGAEYEIVSIETTDGRARTMILICEEVSS